MDSWEDVNPLLLSVPFSSFATDDGQLLLKLLYNSEKSTLAFMATDLTAVYFEALNKRQLQRRLQDALDEAGGESQGSQGVMVGIGEDGEALLHDSVDKLLSVVAEGKAKVRLEQEGFDLLVKITLPGSFTVSFLTTSLEQRSSAVLSRHLVVPLLGVASSLLSLLPDLPIGQEDVLKRIASAVDSSGSSERMREGTAAARFMQVGGGGLVSRWIQKTLKVKEKDLQPVTLTFPSSRSSRPFSPAASVSPVKRKPSASPADASPPPRKVSEASPSSSRPMPSIAQRMLDHHGGGGERVGWEDSQSVSSSSSKGKGRAMEVDDQEAEEQPPAAQANTSVDEEEPPTDDEDGGRPPLAAPSFRRQVSPTPTLGSAPSTQHRSPSRHLSPPPATGQSSAAFLRSPSAAFAASQGSQAFPPPTASPLDAEDNEDAVEAAEKKRQEKDEKKKKQKEKDAEEELARRKARLAKVAAAKGGAGAGKKKAAKKL
ncbi:hypothetical protein JCM6882_007817 [Rhodosporidiobolus microsporus]